MNREKKGLSILDRSHEWNSDGWNSYLKSLDYSLAKDRKIEIGDIQRLSDEGVMICLWQYTDYDSHPVLARSIRLLLEMLSEAQREVVYLIYRDKKSLSDIARLLNQSPVAVSKKKELALKKIRGLILDGTLDGFANHYKDKDLGG